MSIIAKIFMSGRSQAVRLPKEFRLPGKQVRIRRVDGGLLLEPIEELKDVFKELDRYNELYGPFEFNRDQPPSSQAKDAGKRSGAA
jgi:antitoxin VapB